MTAAQRSASFRRLLPDGRFDTIERPLAVEMPVAVEIDGIGMPS